MPAVRSCRWCARRFVTPRRRSPRRRPPEPHALRVSARDPAPGDDRNRPAEPEQLLEGHQTPCHSKPALHANVVAALQAAATSPRVTPAA
jgi:hypothetical protein